MDATLGFVPVSDAELLDIESREVATREELRRLVAELKLSRTVPDYTAPAEVERGRGGQLLRVSPTLQKLQVLTGRATGGVEAIVSWLEQQVGTKGVREKVFKLVTHDGLCIQIREPQPDKVYGRRR